MALGAAVAVVSAPAQVTLATDFADKYSAGVMFDVFADGENLSICYLWINLSKAAETDPVPGGGTRSFALYSKSGTYQGFENDILSWTLLGTFPAASSGSLAPTRIPLAIPVTILANDTAAFYITEHNTNAAGSYIGTLQMPSGQTVAEDDDVILRAGVSLSQEFSGTLTPAAPQVIVQYQPNLFACGEPVFPVTQLGSDVYDGAGGGPCESGEVYRCTPRLGQAFVPAGETLTLKAGSTLKLGDGITDAAALTVNGTLVIEGGVITSIYDDEYGGDSTGMRVAPPAAPGDYLGITIRPGGSVVCSGGQIRYAGESASFAPLRIDVGATANIDRMWFRDNAAGTGFALDASKNPGTVVTNSLWTDNQGAAAGNFLFEDVRNLAGNLAADNLGGDYFHVQGENGAGARPIMEAVTIRRTNYPGAALVVEGNIAAGSGGTLEFEDGVIVKFESNPVQGISASNGGQIIARGKPGSEVVFTSLLDDTRGGDTNKDGTATTPTAGAWGGIRLTPPQPIGQAQLDLDYTTVAWAGSSTGAALDVDIDEGSVRRISIEDSLGDGLRIREWDQGLVSNVVVDGTSAHGVNFQGGAIIANHFTVIGAGGDGFHSGSGFSGSIANSNSWNNIGGNYGGFLNAIQVKNSNGGFSGINGNLDVDPLFEPCEQALSSLSPLIGAGDKSCDTLGTDRLGAPRTSGLELQTDMGALEYVPTGLSRTGLAAGGEQLTLSLEPNAPAGVVSFIFGFGQTEIPINGLGALLVQPPLTPAPFVPTPGTTPFTLPPLPFEYELVIQALVLPTVGAAFLTNVTAATFYAQ